MENAEKERLIMKNLEFLGDRYRQEARDHWNVNKLEHRWEALKFFFEHSFARGRLDKVSGSYEEFTIKRLEELYQCNFDNLVRDKKYFDKESINEFKKKYNIKGKKYLQGDNFERFREEVARNNHVIECLTEEMEIRGKKVYLNNPIDLMMVLDVLKFISEDKEKQNIYKYLKDKIVNSGVKSAYNELTKIYGIGDKIATFIIRDIGLLNDIEFKEEDEYLLAFPVDTWVQQIAERLQEVHKLNCSTGSIKDIKKYFINKCIAYKINPLKVAAGLWSLGSNSHNILIKYFLGNIDFEKYGFI